jgi:DNA adenine methylase
MPAYLGGYVSRIAPAAARLAAVSLESMPALDLIAKYGRDPASLLYVDPPYLPKSRSSGSYLHEMTSADHSDLAAALHGCQAAVVLSGYPSDLYDRDLYAIWYRCTFAASTGQGGTWANRTEVLWSNRPLGEPHLFSAEGAS